MFRIIILLYALALPYLAMAAEQVQNRVLFLMQSGQSAAGLDLYRQYQKELGHHDFELLQQIALSLLDQGFRATERFLHRDQHAQRVQQVVLEGGNQSS